MRKTGKNFICFFLSFLMIFTSLNASVFAESLGADTEGYEEGVADDEGNEDFDDVDENDENSYYIVFKGNGATSGEMEPMTGVYSSDGPVQQINANQFKRKGYRFIGWNKKADGTGSSYVNKNDISVFATGKKVTLYAQWELKEYTVTYELNGGKNHDGNVFVYTFESDTIKLLKPTRKGYTFVGWYKDASFKKKVTEIKSGSTGNLTFYAKWSPRRYTIEFLGNGATSGTMDEVMNCRYGRTYTLSKNLYKRKGYTFIGWNTKEDGTGKSFENQDSVKNLTTKQNGVVQLYAIWSVNQYKISFDGNGATAGTMKDMSCDYGETYALRANKYQRTGYKFTGWNTKADGSGTKYANKENVTSLTSSDNKTITLYAQWKLQKYTITYNLDGGENSKKNPDSYYVTSDTIVLKNAVKTGYSFKGWYSDEAFTNRVKTIETGSAGDLTLYAKWEAKTYTITYELNGGKNSSRNPSEYTIESETITFAKPTRTGYKFLGWYENADFSGAKITKVETGSIGNLTVYAKWQKETYTITYHLAGGENSAENPSQYDITTKTITLSSPKRRGYSFQGWYLDENLTEKIEQIVKGSHGNLDLYAKWKVRTYTITYELNGGTNHSLNPDTYKITTPTIELGTPTKTGYAFLGWYTKSDFSGDPITRIEKGSVGNKTLYAKWKFSKLDGIDVSHWQGAINWKTAKDNGISFVMLKISQNEYTDPNFETYYQGAKSVGLKIGVYCFNAQTTVEGAKEQARYVLKVLNGRKLDYPIAFDMELSDRGDDGSISRELRTDMMFAFKEIVEAAGYKFVLYASTNFLYDYMVNSRLDGVDLWVARYCDYNLGHRYTGCGKVRMWQYSSTGNGAEHGVSSTYVDLDVSYKNY